MNVHGYEIIGDWKVSNMGHTAMATKGGKKYFLKRYGEYKLPRRDASMTDRLYSKLKAEFESFKDNRIAVDETLSELAGPGGNIILPNNWFVDDIFFIEASEYIGGLIEDKDILRLPPEDLKLVMLTAAGSLFNIHRKNIVHSDLKRTNILAARNSSGRIVAKIIDFDRSYFADKIRPDELGGDQSYMSPELTQCFIYDMADEALAYLSTKSDIFSLGLVYHNYLTGGEFPEYDNLKGKLKERYDDGKVVYCGEAALSGADLVISDKIKEEYLSHLIAAMLQPEPADRPAANEVLEILKNKTVLDLKPDSHIKIGGKSAPAPKPAPAPAKAAAPVKAPAPAKPVIPTGICSPWAEHKITIKSSALKDIGFVALEQIDHKGNKCYQAYKSDGSKRVFTVNTLLMLGLASLSDKEGAPAPAKAPAPAPAPAPASSEVYEDGKLWDEDAEYKFDIEAVKECGYKSVARAVKGGKQGYVLIKLNGDQRFMTFDKLKLLRYAVKK